MSRRRLRVTKRLHSIRENNGSLLIGVSDRVRDRIVQAKSGLAEEDYSAGRMMAELTRFTAVGALNVLFFFAVNYVLNGLSLSSYKSLSVWAPSWLIGALEAHAAHRWITFHSRVDYRNSLLWGCVVYGVTAMLSTFSVYLLADLLFMNYWLVWGLNTAPFGLMTFLGLRYLAFPPLPGYAARRYGDRKSTAGACRA